MEMDGRKRKILDAIIRNYLETGEPVGSRTISRYTDLHLSSATIRNEMSDLEEMGFIVQPHTSAGRIPTDKGYRLYVNSIVETKMQKTEAMTSLMIYRTNRLEEMLKQVVRLLASMTNYTTMISAPSYRGSKVKFIQLSRLGPRQLLNVVVIEGNIVRSHIIDLVTDIDEETVYRLNMLLNSKLSGLTLMDINLGLISSMKEEAGSHAEVVSDVLDTIADVIRAETDEKMQIYTSGADNIFRYPELADSTKARKLISTLEEKSVLVDFVKETRERESQGETGIQVYIGDEGPVEDMKDCSVVTASYDLGDGLTGTIGIIGPKRMDYEKAMRNLKEMKKSLDNLFGGASAREPTGPGDRDAPANAGAAAGANGAWPGAGSGKPEDGK